MKVTIVGAAGGEVNGSASCVQTKQASVHVDCGLFQGGKKSEALNRPPTGPKQELDAVLVTDGHLDHTGRWRHSSATVMMHRFRVVPQSPQAKRALKPDMPPAARTALPGHVRQDRGQGAHNRIVTLRIPFQH